MELAIIIIVAVGVVFLARYASKKRVKEVNASPPPVIVPGDAFIDVINAYRAEKEVHSLTPEQYLMKTAKQRIQHLQMMGMLSHNGFTSIKIDDDKGLGEILAKGYRAPETLLSAYKKSPSHDELIVNSKYVYVGSYTENGYNCTLFST